MMNPSPNNLHGPNSLLGVLGMGRPNRKITKPTEKWMADTKSNDGFLVTEADGTTHLPTHTNGKPDHRLMGAAYAALTSNHRGNPYAGPNKSEAIAKLTAMYKSEGLPLPDHVGTKELDSSAFRIYAQLDGKHRWVLTSSSGFEDGDGETITTKALTDDTERMTREANYGALRFWHIGSKAANPQTKHAGVGIDLGDCDFAAMHAHTRIESGTFYNEQVAANLLPHTKELGGSLGFFYPANSSKVISHIHTFERSILPKMHASNLMSRLKRIFIQEESMQDQQLLRLKELVGDEGVATILADVEKREAEHRADGVGLKAAKKPADEEKEDPKEEKTETPAKEAAEDAAESDEMKKKTKEMVDAISDAIALKMQGQFVTPVQLDAKFTELNAVKTKTEGDLAIALKTIDERMKSLEGETPESKKGFKASESSNTLAGDGLTMQLLTRMAQEQGLDLSALGVKGATQQTEADRIVNKMFKTNGQ